MSAARRLIELANAVRAGATREELAEILAGHGERPADLEGFSDADAAELRAAVTRITEEVLTETDLDRAARAINGLLAECGARPRLSRHEGHPWHLHVDASDDAGWGEWLTAASALALAQIVSDQGRTAWGECAASGCRRLFLGTGPGTARRFCSRACATRARVAAHRRRAAGPPAAR